MKTLRLYCEFSGCRKTFRNQVGLDAHIEKDHSSTETLTQSDFKCPDCFKTLSTKQSLKEHLFTHTGEKPYKCQEVGCGLLFRQSSQLSNHKKVHLEIKKNNPEISKINLLLLSKLFANEEKCILTVPSGPFTFKDVELPVLNPAPYAKLRILEVLINNY
jgi:uncharacterized Zn-finger protein